VKNPVIWNPDAEETLIGKAAKGSLEAFNQLVLRYQDKAFYHAYALLGDAASAEDVAQESFIKAFQNIGGFRGGSFRAWLLRIVTNTTYDLYRRSRKHPVQPLFRENDFGEDFESSAWLVDPSASVEATVEQNEDTARLYQLLGELPEIYRTTLTLVDLYEMDYWEAAEALGIPLGTVKSRLARGRVQLWRKLQDNFEYFIYASPAAAAILDPGYLGKI
jgi:RNA polymerase sigma-70 factor (ECF subfamily)